MVQTETMTSSGSLSGKKCACEKNWCPVCRLPTCRPVRDTHWKKGTLNTTYIRDYPEKHALRDPSLNRNQLVPSLAKFNGETTNKADYGPKRAALDKYNRDVSVMPHRPFDGETTYNHFHDGKHGLPHDPRKLPPMLKSAPFEGISTNNADYVDWGNQRRPYTAPPWNIPDLRFDGTSTYQDDYIKKPMPPRDPHAPPTLLPSQHVDNYTTYGTDYIEYPMNRVSGKCCDQPHHPKHYIHTHDHLSYTRPGDAALGNATGKRYTLR